MLVTLVHCDKRHTKVGEITLRITINQDSTTTTLKLEGRLVAAWVAECLQAWQSIVPVLAAKTLCIDLRGLTFVDRNGAELLSQIYRTNHPQFLTSTPLTKYFAEQAIHTSHSGSDVPDTGDGKFE